MRRFLTTTKAQDNLSQSLFRGFPPFFVTMSTDLQYPSGLVTYTFNLVSDRTQILQITVDRRGTIVSPAPWGGA